MVKQQKRAFRLPTEVFDEYWIHAKRSDPYDYPAPTERCGKWMIYAHLNEVDQVWSIIRDAVVAGLLGSSAKVATMKSNSNAVDPDTKVICIYTYDSEDQADVVRILTALREELLIAHKAFYKEDNATDAGRYSFNTRGPVSKYWANYGETQLRIPKGR